MDQLKTTDHPGRNESGTNIKIGLTVQNQIKQFDNQATIANYNSRTLLIEAVRTMLLKGLYLIGSELPTNDMEQYLTTFIINNFRAISTEEIFYAFECAAAKKYDVDLRTFGNPNAAFVGGLLRKYIDWKSTVKQKNPNMAIQGNTQPKMIDDKKLMEQFIVKSMEQYKSGIDWMLCCWCDIYDFWDNQGLIDLSNIEKNEYMDKARKHLSGLRKSTPTKTETITIAKKMIVRDRFNQLIKNT